MSKRLQALVVSAVLIVGGPVASWFIGMSEVFQARGVRRWQEVPCAIAASSIERAESRNVVYRPTVLYEYEVGGRTYRSDKRQIGVTWTTTSWRKAKRVVARYPVGSEATCYVSPADPQEAVLEPGVSSSTWIAVFVPLGFSCFGVTILVGLLLGKIR